MELLLYLFLAVVALAVLIDILDIFTDFMICQDADKSDEAWSAF